MNSEKNFYIVVDNLIKISELLHNKQYVCARNLCDSILAEFYDEVCNG